MNRKIICLVMLACLLILSANSAVFAQAFGNDAQWLVGTWTEVSGNGDTLVFNANGTTTGWGWTHWIAIDDRLVMTRARRSGRSYEWRFSNDGRTLIIIALDGEGWLFRRD